MGSGLHDGSDLVLEPIFEGGVARRYPLRVPKGVNATLMVRAHCRTNRGD